MIGYVVVVVVVVITFITLFCCCCFIGVVLRLLLLLRCCCCFGYCCWLFTLLRCYTLLLLVVVGWLVYVTRYDLLRCRGSLRWLLRLLRCCTLRCPVCLILRCCLVALRYVTLPLRYLHVAVGLRYIWFVGWFPFTFTLLIVCYVCSLLFAFGYVSLRYVTLRLVRCYILRLRYTHIYGYVALRYGCPVHGSCFVVD